MVLIPKRLEKQKEENFQETNTDPFDNFISIAAEIGVPQDAIQNFLQFGIVLQPKQLMFCKAARECDLPGGPTMVGLGGARGGGKSFGGLAQVGIDDSTRFPGLKSLFLRKVGKAAKESFDDLRQNVFKYKKYKYNRHEGILEFSNGSRIILGNFKDEKEIDNYLGQEYDIILIEEATTLSLKKVKYIRSCNRSGFNKNPDLLPWRPRMYLTFNPGGIGHAWVKDMFVIPFRESRETNTRFIPSTVDDNLFVNDDYVDILESFTGWLYRAWRLGDWDVAAGQFFVTWSDQDHIARHDIDILPNWKVWLSMDYGFTHYQTVYLLTETGDGDIIILDEHAAMGWLPERHSNAMDDMLERNHIDRSRLSKIVGGHDFFSKDEEGRTIADTYRQLGWKIDKANIDRIQGAAEFLKRLGDPLEISGTYIRPTIKIHQRCAKLIDNIPTLTHDPKRPEDVLKVNCDEDGNGGDDFYDGARYGIMLARLGSANVALEAAKALAGIDDDEDFSSENPDQKQVVWSMR